MGIPQLRKQYVGHFLHNIAVRTNCFPPYVLCTMIGWLLFVLCVVIGRLVVSCAVCCDWLVYIIIGSCAAIGWLFSVLCVVIGWLSLVL